MEIVEIDNVFDNIIPTKTRPNTKWSMKLHLTLKVHLFESIAKYTLSGPMIIQVTLPFENDPCMHQCTFDETMKYVQS